jgi:hypothetical protein
MSQAMSTSSLKPRRPWYREPWPWLLMLGPFIVILAGIYTAWLAMSSSDGLVTDDYYKKGLKVDQTIARSERARALGLVAAVRVTADTLSLRLSAADTAFVAPERLVVTVSHPTRAGLDQTHVMARDGGGYAAKFRLPASGHWLVQVEDEARTWRLLGNVVLPAAGEVLIGGGAKELSRHP